MAFFVDARALRYSDNQRFVCSATFGTSEAWFSKLVLTKKCTPKWPYVTFYEYLMKTLSFWKINVIFQFWDLKLVIVPNFTFLRRCLTPKWQYVTFYEYLMKTLSFWKINVIFQFLDSILVTIQILTSVWPFLTFLYHHRWSHCMVVWQYVISLIFNEGDIHTPII